MPESLSICSASPCLRMRREGESGAAPRIENFTTCRTPARFAARMKFASRATCSAESGDSRNARSTPASAASSEVVSSKFPRTNSTFSVRGNFVSSRLRTIARALTPLAASCLRISRPFVPVAPVIRIITPPAHSAKESCDFLTHQHSTDTYRKQPTKMLRRRPKRQKNQAAL